MSVLKTDVYVSELQEIYNQSLRLVAAIDDSSLFLARENAVVIREWAKSRLDHAGADPQNNLIP